MPDFTFHQVDVFSSIRLKGNPLAVVSGADDLSETEMAAFANWTSLSETTFLLRPSVPEADYRVRIFTPFQELPFAGHPTLGSAWVWRATGGQPARTDTIIQECGAGLVSVRQNGTQLAFIAPPMLRSGPVSPELLAQTLQALGLSPAQVTDSAWTDNGPGFFSLLLDSRKTLLNIRPDYARLGNLKVGLVAPCEKEDSTDAQFELRLFFCSEGRGFEDPVTGSLNAAVAKWLADSGRAPEKTWTAIQGTALGRQGRISLTREGDDILVGGSVVPCISGTVTL
ncbi:PhzF family phenazine biosynthesis protein [Acetobacter sp. AN02]|uniref:PhzF family phenazine biosynthesis protein n=1 Tax=Acetobacter sp. AN02 TaxID=2894186 RepID=UPI0024341C82|nr:PhzF family phenazine biosynthesis protein [Acetobacter sp. AN02]MDG6095319.1 PhzF family phenazine biosynthesis protein [Acetobacter sp. AN02]